MKITTFQNRRYSVHGWQKNSGNILDESNGTLFQTFLAFLELQKFQWAIFAPWKSYFTKNSRWVPLAHFESLPAIHFISERRT